jgi:transcriptional regulator with XRE-family HTH domain
MLTARHRWTDDRPINQHSDEPPSAQVRDLPAEGDVEALIAATPASRLGSALSQQRQHAGLGAAPAAAGSGLGSRQLRAFESGRRKPDPATVARLLGFYGSSFDELLPPRRPIDPVSFEGLSDSAILTHHLGQVRRRRDNKSPQGFRRDDIEVLVGILGTDPRTIESKLRALTGCNRRTAKTFRRILVTGLVATGSLPPPTPPRQTAPGTPEPGMPQASERSRDGASSTRPASGGRRSEVLIPEGKGPRRRAVRPP